MIFHEQHLCWYGFPSQPLATCASAGVSECFSSTHGHSDTSSEARVARSINGKPYPHSCRSWKVTFSNSKTISQIKNPCRIKNSSNHSRSGPAEKLCRWSYFIAMWEWLFQASQATQLMICDKRQHSFEHKSFKFSEEGKFKKRESWYFQLSAKVGLESWLQARVWNM